MIRAKENGKVEGAGPMIHLHRCYNILGFLRGVLPFGISYFWWHVSPGGFPLY